VRSFGSKGSGDGQFQFGWPVGIVADGEGNLWVTDGHNDRVQWWRLGWSRAPGSEAVQQDDPAVEVETSNGLVNVVEGEEAGLHLYAHSGDLLTAHGSAEGTTQYAYDGNGRMTKVTLPNGTYGEIAYEASYGRVISVAVAIEGKNPQTTYFTYEDQPQRRTTVTAPGIPVTTYEFAADGSMLKWWNTKEPPKLDDVGGTLHDKANRETATPIQPGLYNLTVQAFSAHGIASIKVITNNDTLVSEKTCTQDPDPEVECESEKNEWVMETGSFPPGILYIEVIATSSLGESTSERFWVNVPYTPPPDPEIDAPPKFSEISKFREEFGLDLDIKGDEEAINDRIFNLIGDWHNPNTPAGEVARATREKWGVPLRTADAAELEYREWFYNLNAERIDQWVEVANPNNFAGYYIDHAAGGFMHIGFTGSQNESLEALKTSLALVAGERLQVYPTTPTISLLSVRAASQSVANALESNSTLDELVVSVKEDEAGKAVYIGTPDVAQVKNILNQMLGPSPAIIVEYDTGSGSPLSGRFRNQGRMRAGDFVVARHYSYNSNGLLEHDGNADCTAGFGAKDKADEVRGDTVWRTFLLSAGHCTGFAVYAKHVFRSTDADALNEDHWTEVGPVARDAFTDILKKVRTDAEAIRIYGSETAPQGIYGWNGDLIPTGQAGKARKGDILCFSGAKTQVPKCGKVVARSIRWTGSDGVARGGYWVKFATPATHGDSGAPVWSKDPGFPSIGLVTAGRPLGSFTETLVEPLLHPYRMPSNVVPGILHDPSLRPLSLKHR